MLHSQDQYRRACRVVDELEAKVRNGTASVAERERAANGAQEVVMYELVREGAAMRGRKLVHPAAPLDPDVPSLDDITDEDLAMLQQKMAEAKRRMIRQRNQ